jgi:hypothetical protein
VGPDHPDDDDDDDGNDMTMMMMMMMMMMIRWLSQSKYLGFPAHNHPSLSVTHPSQRQLLRMTYAPSLVSR